MSAAAAATAAQIADAMGCPKSTVIRRAQAEGWSYIEEPGRGGVRRLYQVEHLPAALRAKLAWGSRPTDATPETRAAAQAGKAEAARLALRGSLEARATQARQQTTLRQAGELDPTSQARMDARLAVVRACELFMANLGPTMPQAQARLLFVQRYNAGDVDVLPAVRAELPTTSDSSIERWQREIRTRGITALAGAYGNRAGTSKVDSHPELREFVQAMLVQYPHARATQVARGLRARFRPSDLAAHLPSMRSLERWMNEWRSANREVLQALENPDAWKNKHMVAFGSKSELVTAINQLWERDSSPADVMCTDGRYSLIAGVDVFTRSASLLVSKTSKAVAVGAHLRTMLLAFGVPDADKTDNGSDYTALYTERVYDALAIKHELCPPFQPWHKPHVERFFGTFTRDLVELLPGYIGHSVAERNAIEARKSFADRLMKRGEVVELKMTGAELQAFCDSWLETIYSQQPHEGLAGRTPFELRAAHQAQVRHIADERTLDLLLADAPGRDGQRTVQKKGIKLDEGWFIAPELEAWVGHSVHVRYDPVHHDLGTVFVFGGDPQAFICMAQNPERTGMDRREVAVKAKALQRDRVQTERRALKAAAKKVGVDHIVGEILRDRAQATGKLAALPVRRTPANTHTSAGLDAAAAALNAATAPQRTSAQLEDLAAAQRAQLARQAAQANPGTAGTPNELAIRRSPQPAPQFESIGARVQWLLREARLRELCLEEREYLAEFRRTNPASYRRMDGLVADQMGPQKENAPGAVAGPSGAV